MVKSLVECGSQFTDPRSAEKVSFANSQSLVNQKRQFLINEQIRMIEYLLYEQQYMELIAQGETIKAIEVLQVELYPRAPL